jgi:hypothetical protein
MKPSRIIPIFAAGLLIAPSLLADTTVHYKNEMKLGALMQRVLGPAAESMKAVMPSSTTIQIKGTKELSTNGRFESVSDLGKQVITLIDPAHNQYATVYMKDYMAEVFSAMPGPQPVPADAQKILDSMTSTFSSAKTGKTETIMGVQAEETVMTLEVKMPDPSATSSAGATQAAAAPVDMMQMVIHLWTALPSEVDRIAGLKELAGVYGDPAATAAINPSALMGKAFQSMPGMGKGFASMMDEMMQKKAILVEMQLEMNLPFAQAALAQQANSKDPAHPVDSKEPFATITMQVDQISVDPIADKVFEVPDGFHVVSVPEFLKAVAPVPPSSTAAKGSDSDSAPAPAETQAATTHKN